MGSSSVLWILRAKVLLILPSSVLLFLPSLLPHPSFFLLCLQLFLCTPDFSPYSPWSCLIPSIFPIFYFLILIFSWVYCDKPLKYFILKYFKEVCTFHVLSLSFHWLCKPFNWFFLLPHQYIYQWCSVLPKCTDIFFCFTSLLGHLTHFPLSKGSLLLPLRTPLFFFFFVLLSSPSTDFLLLNPEIISLGLYFPSVLFSFYV